MMVNEKPAKKLIFCSVVMGKDITVMEALK